MISQGAVNSKRIEATAKGVHLSGGNDAPVGRLICLPYAGGSAAMLHGLRNYLDSSIDLMLLEYPGHGRRRLEPPQVDITLMARDLADECETSSDVPFILFGHSMGAAVAVELAHLLLSRDVRPKLVIASGRRGPLSPSRNEPIASLPDKDLLARLVRLGGTPPELAAHPELMELVLPTLRADLMAGENYVYRHSALLDLNFAAYGGLSDPYVTADELKEWKAVTTRPPHLRLFPGDHFYLHQDPRLLGEALSREFFAHA